jgi:uracil phosphoribosyltransferase
MNIQEVVQDVRILVQEATDQVVVEVNKETIVTDQAAVVADNKETTETAIIEILKKGINWQNNLC